MSVNFSDQANTINSQASRYQRGAVFTYILASLLAIGALGAAMSALNDKAVSAERAQFVRESLRNDIVTVRDQILLCRTLYPSAGMPVGINVSVSTLDCPGVPTANKNLWTSINGQIPPKNISGMNGWFYTNDATGIFIQNAVSSSSDTQTISLANKVATKLSPQADWVGGNTLKYWVLKY